MDLYELLCEHSHYNLSHVVQELVLPAEHYIYIPGEHTNAMYEILEGAIKLGSYGSSGQEVTYDVLTLKNTFGNLKLLNGQFFEFAKCITATRVRSYRPDFFKKVIVKEPAVSEWFIKNVVRRWSLSEARLLHIRSFNNEEKISALFNQFNHPITDATGKSHDLFSLLTMQDLGDLSGMTRQTASQTLKKINQKSTRVTA